MITTVLGVDPGPTTGVAWLWYPGVPMVFQCNAVAAEDLVAWILAAADRDRDVTGITITAAGEAFAAGRGAGARMHTAQVTRQVIAALDALPVTWHWRNAGTVKPWATDRRLDGAGLYDLTNGQPHARDACRHALYAAVHDCGLPDPLSKKKD